MSPQFLRQTANDYDMPLHEVEKIANQWPAEFYAKLEEYIESRANKAEKRAEARVLRVNKIKYLELIQLAEYYRWSAIHSRANATGARSPLTGQQYGTSAAQVHHDAHRKSQIGMAMVYILAAEKVRLQGRA